MSPRFVVHQHAARRLHYDFRLEVEGALASWAVPKGPSYDPRVKRLAVQVEDHDLGYGTFEGVIGQGRYGSGAVIVWDQGEYRNLTSRDGAAVAMDDAVRRGHLSVWLEGTKLRGGWSLTRTGGPQDQAQWILVKRADETADPTRDVTASSPGSVVTGLSIEAVAAGATAGPAPGAAAAEGAEAAVFVPPMLATLAEPPLGVGDWVYERKLDGLRCLAVRNGSSIELWSRNRLSFTPRFPAIVAELGALPANSFALDGELVAFDGERTSFSLLQQGGDRSDPVYRVFDVVSLLGRDTTDLPLVDRHALVGQALGPAGRRAQPVEWLEGTEATLLERACRSGWEGLVAKSRASRYESGRSRAWRKLKCSVGQELVIGGWTDPSGSRTGLGAVLVGYYQDGALRYAGRVGTGFDQATLGSLHAALAGLATTTCPFDPPPPGKGMHWARPRLVAQVKFAEWTPDGVLRHPSFEGLRPDKDPRQVRRETPPGQPGGG